MGDQKEKLLISPEICAWADEDHDLYKIEIPLPGVEKDTIKLRIHEDSFFITGETDNTTYIGSYVICCPVKPDKAEAHYKNGLLKIEVPFKDPMEDAIDIEIK